VQTLGDYSGYSVKSAGDVNGDGYADVIIGAYGASPNSRPSAGITYVVYGSASIPGTIELSSLGSRGFAINGPGTNYYGNTYSILIVCY
jgi:hypothetical protein